MAEAAQQLLGAIAALPPSVNPYEFVDKALFHQIIPEVEPIFFYNIYISYGLYAIGFVAGFVALSARIYTASLWIFRVRKTYDGTLLMANTTLLLSFWSTTFFFINLITLWFLLHSVRDGASPAVFQAFTGLNWLPICCAGWTSAYGVCASSFLSRHRQRLGNSRLSMSARRAASTVPSAAASALISFGFPVGFIAQFAIIMPLFGISYLWFKKTWDAYQAIKAQIAPAAAAWTEGQAFVFDPRILPLFEDFVSKGEITIQKMTSGFIGYAFVLGFILAIFLPGALVYLSILSSNLENYMENLSEQSRVADSRVKELQSTYRFMRMELLLVSLVTITLLSTVIYIAAHTKDVFAQGKIFTIIYAIALYAFSIFTMPLNCILAFRALRPLMMSRSDSKMGVTAAIQVQTMVERFVEGEDFEKPVALNKISDAPETERGRPAIVTFDVDTGKEEYEQKTPEFYQP